MAYETIILEHHETVLLIRLNRPEALNAINGKMLKELCSVLEKSSNDVNVRVIVLTGSEKFFAAGADIKEMEKKNSTEMYLDDYFTKEHNVISSFRKPIIAGVSGYALGGGCELSLHADAVQAAAESYIGLVELGVGLIPGGGGTKEMALRASQMYYDGDIELPRLKEFFINIGQAKVATSAHEAFDLGYLQNGKDNISINSDKLIQDAKEKVNFIHNLGYTKPIMNKNIKVLGKDGLGMFLIGADTFEHGGYITKHEQLMCEKLAYVLCGGNLSSPTNVTEQYLLDIEREAFLSLCGEPKTLERIKHMLEKGKPLRN